MKKFFYLGMILGKTSQMRSTGKKNSPGGTPPRIKTGGKGVALVACGDIGLYGRLEEKLCQEGSLPILGDATDVLNNADLVFGNLEGPISDRGTRHVPPPYPALRMNPGAISFLKEGGFGIVSLSNNHMLDYGYEALLDTIKRLDEAGIRHFGAGKNEEEAWRPQCVDIRGVRCGFLGFHEGGAAAGEKSPGSSLFNKKRAVSAIRQLKRDVDVVIVSYHFGFDYFTCPSPFHIDLCRSLIDNGAHLILGHHPHVPQAYERYANGLIAYSLGNFTFHLGDSFPNKSQEGFMVQVNLTKDGVDSFKIIPYKFDVDLSVKLWKDQVLENRIKEYMRLSECLIDISLLRQQWYENLRNSYLGHLFYYWKSDALKGKPISFFKRIISLFKPNVPNYIKLRSLLYFLFTGYAFQQELKRINRKYL